MPHHHHHPHHSSHPHSAPSQPPYWLLAARAKGLRNAASIGFGIHHYASPAAPSPSSTKWIDATLGDHQGKRVIRLDIYYPKGFTPVTVAEKRPGVIIFHGGGFVLGHGTDDARWAAAAADQLGAVSVAVSYRLAPEHPFPTCVNDCASAILYVGEHAAALGIDPSQLFISGFSAGGNLAFSSHHLLHSPATWGLHLPQPPPPIRGIIAYYPLLDYSLSRTEKREACAHPEFTLAPSLTTLFDSSYLPPSVDLLDARLSPGRAPDEMIEALPPVHLVLCEYDMLHAEGLVFRDRLEEMGRVVSMRQVDGEKHAWDKPLPLAPKPSVMEEYTAALDVMKGWLGKE
ncbi:hypothetical protein IAT38_001854 [Cryptococcus sp. DSM 104549]